MGPGVRRDDTLRDHVNDTFEARLRYTTSTGRARGDAGRGVKLYGPDFMIEIKAIAAG